jgi:hypothetical protein
MDFDIVWTYISDRPKKTYDMNISTACVLRSSGTIFQTTKHTDHVSTPCVAKMVWKHIPDKERLTTCLMLTYGHFCEIIVWKHFPDKQRYFG